MYTSLVVAAWICWACGVVLWTIVAIDWLAERKEKVK